MFVNEGRVHCVEDPLDLKYDKMMMILCLCHSVQVHGATHPPAALMSLIRSPTISLSPPAQTRRPSLSSAKVRDLFLRWEYKCQSFIIRTKSLLGPLMLS